ncbi:type II toxin-antitoxin system RelE/ParE family toxin [Lactobacillus sp. ESL0684]|uniref:type II toxin-antitoxin system RelE/ParE family toxin n=1 Tax=Lactobacillus sp. ESL0684 TaxID=2983213 RepID=UPI0023FA2A4F|nr:type II toxin-antitoxin system RelE/ParE family toxin [Lactobacillus sp. ESL0684]WEV43548.1 type II toxin-antitoxin system RelE/ParE family toxin [Lactobacillus sp. ESL0684]
MKKLEFEYFDEEEFEEFLDALSRKESQKLLATIYKVEQWGLTKAQRQKWVKKLENNLYEIRSEYSSNNTRAVYFHFTDNHYVITHGFKKKTQKTPPREILKGVNRRNDYLKRNGRNGSN